MKRKQHCYEYPRPALTVDCVVFGYEESVLKVLLIERNAPPFERAWALPGGFVGIEETIDEAARRELEEETGIDNVFLEQLYTFGEVERDPRGRVVSVAYYALVALAGHTLHAATDARDAQWFSLRTIPTVAFDHAHILGVAIERLRAKVRYQPVGFELLPKKFTLTQLQHLYEAILGQSIDKRNFRKKILAMGILKPLDEYQQGVKNRPAQLYAFDRKKYRQLTKNGFHFEV